jgi:nickel/cobalt exporter
MTPTPRRFWARRMVAVGLLVVAGSVLSGAPASAHPTDELLQQAYLTPAASGLTVRLDLTPGTLVAPQFARTLDADGDGALSTAETAAAAADVRRNVAAQVDGAPVDLTPTRLAFPALDLLAAGGGTITLEWAAPLPAGAHEVAFTDDYAPGGRTAVQISVYVPSDPVPLGAIRHAQGGRAITVALNPDPAGAAPATGASTDSPAESGSSMLDALRRPLISPGALLALVGACVLLGALHALTPGHGKTLLAAYLVGGRNTPAQAVTLGIVITASHTAAVFAVGALVLVAGRYVTSGVVVPALTIGAGLLVLVLGVRLVRRRWRPLDGTGHGHGHHHGHPHQDAGVAVATRPGLRSLAALGLSAGMIPCPEALSVLLLAIGLHRAGLGLVMIVAFSAGPRC